MQGKPRGKVKKVETQGNCSLSSPSPTSVLASSHTTLFLPLQTQLPLLLTPVPTRESRWGMEWGPASGRENGCDMISPSPVLPEVMVPNPICFLCLGPCPLFASLTPVTLPFYPCVEMKGKWVCVGGWEIKLEWNGLKWTGRQEKSHPPTTTETASEEGDWIEKNPR